MTINKTMEDGIITIALEGKLDTGSAPELQDVLIPAFDEIGDKKGCIVLDFAKLAYVSSAGLRVLFFGQKTARDKQGSMKIINVSENIKDIFNITGFKDIFIIE